MPDLPIAHFVTLAKRLNSSSSFSCHHRLSGLKGDWIQCRQDVQFMAQALVVIILLVWSYQPSHWAQMTDTEGWREARLSVALNVLR